jgi:hypothetical protein
VAERLDDLFPQYLRAVLEWLGEDLAVVLSCTRYWNHSEWESGSTRARSLRGPKAGGINACIHYLDNHGKDVGVSVPSSLTAHWKWSVNLASLSRPPPPHAVKGAEAWNLGPFSPPLGHPQSSAPYPRMGDVSVLGSLNA